MCPISIALKIYAHENEMVRLLLDCQWDGDVEWLTQILCPKFIYIELM